MSLGIIGNVYYSIIEARFKLLSEGPSVLAMKSLEERLQDYFQGEYKGYRGKAAI